MWSLPINTVATLVVGLRENSRIMLKVRGEQLAIKEQLLAGILDRLSVIVWWLGGAEKTKKPTLIADSFIKREDKSRNDKFASGEEFMKAWQGK